MTSGGHGLSVIKRSSPIDEPTSARERLATVGRAPPTRTEIDRFASATSDDILRGPRLVLEPLVPAHAEAPFAGFADPRLYTYTPIDPPASIDALHDCCCRLATRSSPDGHERWLDWAARLAAAPIHVGLFEATVRLDATASLAHLLFSEHARRGHGVEEPASWSITSSNRSACAPSGRISTPETCPRSGWSSASVLSRNA